MVSGLARELAAHPRWRWMPGMKAVFSDGSYCRVHDAVRSAGWDGERFHRLDGLVPALDDPATVGCLLAQLPAGWTAGSHAQVGGDTVYRVLWFGGRGAPERTDWCPTLGEAVARALLACWGPA